ncbi:unnamed protein product [Ilex paraguariensis]|uniref:Sulfhydryl oxidase n=1 Tax=Ilex paraguariensis TaxID=185542 RepID=A0ABC8RMQ4_9AQUA
MSENLLQGIFQASERVSQFVQTHLSQFIGLSHHPSPTNDRPGFSLSSSLKANLSDSSADSAILQPKGILKQGQSATPVTKEELGRSTWTFLHTLAAQVI